MGLSERPLSGPLVLATALAVAFLPARAQVSEAETGRVHDTRSGDSAAVSDAGAVETNQVLAKPTDLRSLCQALASAAAQNGLPFEFFTRIIWQESRFNSGAIGPVTRGGERAQGIAQFMPATALERSLRDPFDPFEALPKSAEFLRELQVQFGNLGLAAAAYNAGPQRVRDWLDGKRTLPSETQAYVQIVTGHSAQEWKLSKPAVLAVAVPDEMSCTESAKLMQKPQLSAAASLARPEWVAQLVGDSSETAALARFRQMQGRLRNVLGSYEPTVVRTTIKAVTAPIWVRVRIEFGTRKAAESLCAKLEAAREPCLVQRNFVDATVSRK
jgi:Transglycosylase SLT domain